MAEIYISIDVEASGPIPGNYSMLSLGAAVVGRPDLSFYVELKPLNGNFIAEALAVSGLKMDKLAADGKDPKGAIDDFAGWVGKVSGIGRPVFVSFGTFDWMFVKWYLVKFGHGGLFGPNGLDMKSYYAGMMNVGLGSARKKLMGEGLKSKRRHTHNALDDALEQAEMFERFLKFNKNRLQQWAESNAAAKS